MALNHLTIPKVYNGVVNILNGKYGENNYTLKSFAISGACSAEDNFLSEIYAIRLGVTYKKDDETVDEDIGLIGKSQIVHANSAIDIQRYVFNLIFTKEMLLYTTILPRMETLSLEMGRQKNVPLSPKLHYHYTEGEAYNCLFMDNLISEGFYIPKTHGTGIGLDECCSVMKAIARFHALSLVIESQDGVALSEKHEVCTAEFFLCEATSNSMIPIVQGAYDGIIELAERYRPELVPILERLQKEETVWDRLCSLVKPGTSSFSCLCHGDARLNNIFINKEDISSVRFIDFQLTRYASPLTDLQYILHMGATKQFRDKYTEQVLQTYYDEFTSILSGFPSLKLLPAQEAAVRGWTFEKLKEEYEATTMYGILIAFTLLPIILLKPGDIDKGVSQMSKDEREKFWNEGRQAMVFELGCKHSDVRERLFDICDEAAALVRKQSG